MILPVGIVTAVNERSGIVADGLCVLGGHSSVGGGGSMMPVVVLLVM